MGYTPGASGQQTMTQLVSHRNRTDNPHVVGWAQTGAASASQGTKADTAVQPADLSTAINNLVNAAPGALDTLGELAAALQSDESVTAALIATVAGKATAAQGVKADQAALSIVEVDISSVPCNSGHFDIASSGLTPGNAAQVFQVAGPYTGKGTLADEAEMDFIGVVASCISSTVIRCYWNATGAVAGNFKFAFRT